MLNCTRAFVKVLRFSDDKYEYSPLVFSSFYRGASCLKSPRFKFSKTVNVPVDFSNIEQSAGACQPQSTAPPFMFTISPVMWRDQSDRRKQIDKAMSSVVAIRLSGIESITL